MSDEVKVVTGEGKIYYINERGGWYYVTKPSFFPLTESVDSASNPDDAFEIIEKDSGESRTTFSLD